MAKERVNAVADSDLFAEGVGDPEALRRIGAAMTRGLQTRDWELDVARRRDELGGR